MDILNRYRESHNSSSSDDDSENSDTECAVWKRATKKKTDNNELLQNNEMNDEPLSSTNNEKEQVEQPQQLPEQPKPTQKRKRNTIWCDVLQDQLISEDFEECLLKNKPRHYGSRGKESYDYTNAYADDRKDSDSEMSGCSLNGDSGANSNCKKQKLNKKRSFPGRKKFKKFVKLDSAELDAARKINKVLQEKKYYLIQRIVKFAGIEKAMHYLEQTKKIEDNGGLMIKNNSRRRTPGGVYLQMLKEDKDVTQEMLGKIFEGEMSGHEMKKYFEEKRKKKQKKSFKHNSKEASKAAAEAGIEPMEPDDAAAMDAVSDVRMLFAPMDAEPTTDEKTDVQSSDINVPSVPVTDSKLPENLSDLEDGEIED